MLASPSPSFNFVNFATTCKILVNTLETFESNSAAHESTIIDEQQLLRPWLTVLRSWKHTANHIHAFLVGWNVKTPNDRTSSNANSWLKMGNWTNDHKSRSETWLGFQIKFNWNGIPATDRIKQLDTSCVEILFSNTSSSCHQNEGLLIKPLVLRLQIPDRAARFLSW